MDKPALILLPGLLCNEAAWAPQMTGLADIADIHVASLYGFDSITGMAEAVLARMPAQASVAGHSMGARVALEMVRLAPDRVTRLALLDTGTHTVRPGEHEKRMALVELSRREGMRALVDNWLPPMLHPDHLHDPPLMAAMQAMIEAATPDIFAGQQHALLNRPEAESHLAAIGCPVLVGCGRQDAWSPPAQHEAIAAAVPGATLVLFENSGHMAPVEAPQAVNDAMRRWMAVPAKT